MQVLSVPVLAAAICGAALSGCGDNPSPAPPSMVSAWNNHFAAFGAGVAAQDDADPSIGTTAALDQIMLDYDANSVVRLYQYGNFIPLATYDTEAEIRIMFDQLFAQLGGCNGAADDQLKAQTVVDETGMQVFLVWRCTRQAYFRATDTFIFEGAKIRQQNIVVAKSATLAADRADSLVEFRRLSNYTPTTVSEAWTNHAEAFMAGAASGNGRDDVAKDAALDKIMLDYDANSVVRIYTFDRDASLLPNNFVTHTGMTEIRTMFDGLFGSFTSVTAPDVPQALQIEIPSKQVFLIWSAPDSGYKEATDTFIFDDNLKIRRQNIVLFMTA